MNRHINFKPVWINTQLYNVMVLYHYIVQGVIIIVNATQLPSFVRFAGLVAIDELVLPPLLL